jgi:hypothetical protein
MKRACVQALGILCPSYEFNNWILGRFGGHPTTAVPFKELCEFYPTVQVSNLVFPRPGFGEGFQSVAFEKGFPGLENLLGLSG